MTATSSGEAILGAQNITKSYGAQPVLQDISLTIHERERVGLIGRNGSGKSTLVKILAGLDEPDSGLVTRRQGLRVSMLSQECRLDRAMAVGAILEEPGKALQALFAAHEAAAHALASCKPGNREYERLTAHYMALHHELEMVNAWNLPVETQRFRAALGLPEDDRLLGTLSGGELRRVDLAQVLLSHPDVLLLDEPTNHIDTRSAEWIESFLAGYEGSCVLVTHDRYFLDQIVSRIVEIDGSRLYSFPGNYERFLEYKAQIQFVEAQTERSRQGTLRRELAWLQRGARARTTKEKARIRKFEEISSQKGPEIREELVFEIPPAPRLGKRILEADQIAYERNGRVLFKDFTLIMQQGMRVGVVGANGCGKTTLIRVLMGQEPPKRGTVFAGETVQFLYVDQVHEEIDPNKTILDFVSNGAYFFEVNGRRLFVPGYLERFLFDAGAVQMPMRNLSGGERNRIELAKKLLRGGNFLVLDEPTNDLDLPTLRVLEEAIAAFDGCALLVSHDRYFLNRLCTHLIVFEENEPRLLYVTGNYDDYLIYKEKKAKEVAAVRVEKAKPVVKQAGEPKPHRLTYKERQELEGMEAVIEAAEAEVARLEGVVNGAEFYTQEYTVVQEELQRLTDAKEGVERLYQRWHDLEEKRERSQ